jgi:hypothetical protein
LVEQRGVDLHRGLVDRVFGSIVEGSPLTGAPGQPVDTGFLKGSWHQVPETPLTTRIETDAPYAQGIEDGINLKTGGPIQLRAPTGGFHSVKLTAAGWQHLVDDAVREFGESGTAVTPQGIAVKV